MTDQELRWQGIALVWEKMGLCGTLEQFGSEAPEVVM
jgi:hypothetical protein